MKSNKEPYNHFCFIKKCRQVRDGAKKFFSKLNIKNMKQQEGCEPNLKSTD